MGIIQRFFGKRDTEIASPTTVTPAECPPTAFTKRATAYLKGQVTNSDPQAIQLSREDSPVLRSFADGLLVSYVVDIGQSYEFVQNRHLDLEGVEEEELHRVGIENLTRMVNERQTRVQPYGNIFAVLMGGDFEASLMLIDSLWDQQFRQFVQGDYAVAVPARDVLSFCDSKSADGLAELHQLIGRLFPSGDHLLSNRIYVRRQGKWEAKQVQ